MAKIAFVQNLAYEYLGVMYLSSVLKKAGHDVEIFIGDGGKRLIEEVIEYDPGIVAFSCTTGLHRWCLKMAEDLKKRSRAFMVLGGPHPTFFPEMIMSPGVDGVCIGEGEAPLLELAGGISNSEDISGIRNWWLKLPGENIIKNEIRNLIEDLDSLPFPDRELYSRRYPSINKSQKAFITARGCPFNCSFCFNHAMKKIYAGKGKYVRRRSIKNVIEEIKEVKNNYNLKVVYIQDDTFTLDKEWIREFSDVYKSEIALPFICLIRADTTDEETIRLLKNANCTRVFFGIESGDEGLRNNLLSKGVTDKEIFETAALLKKYKIPFRTYNMLGLPGETIEQAFKTIDINVKIGTDYPWCSLFQPYPRTVLGESAVTMGYLDRESNIAESSFFRTTVLKSPQSRELANLQKLFFWNVKIPIFKPLIGKLIKLPSNFVFDIFFLIGYGYCFLRSESFTLKELMTIGVNNLKRFFFSSSS
ncbi:MAG: B12-binding domain-containing radical SAM protein [Candidatus Schekmanbacteria bacterium]|nr:B12-binding domain-containing radical SAM protein [Candidatus Schekmanbacteria bacterium]